MCVSVSVCVCVYKSRRVIIWLGHNRKVLCFSVCLLVLLLFFGCCFLLLFFSWGGEGLFWVVVLCVGRPVLLF